MSEDCIFCKIVRGEIPSERVFENEDFIVIRDANPQVEGHMLIVSKRHFADVTELDSRLYGRVFEIVREVVGEEEIENFNLVVNKGKVAGQLVGHFHMHILPRVEGDGFGLGV